MTDDRYGLDNSTSGNPLGCHSMCPQVVRLITLLIMFTAGLWMFAGVAQLFLELPAVFTHGWTGAAEHAIVSCLLLLALLEVVRTLQAYLTLGRVRVTFILDTALVVLIGELMGLWFREYAPEKVLLSLGVIAALVGLRIADRSEARGAVQGCTACAFATARFSPELAHA